MFGIFWGLRADPYGANFRVSVVFVETREILDSFLQARHVLIASLQERQLFFHHVTSLQSCLLLILILLFREIK